MTPTRILAVAAAPGHPRHDGSSLASVLFVPEFDSTPYPDGFALIVSSPDMPVAVPVQPCPIQGTPRARRFQVKAQMRCRFADDQDWRTAVTRNISHSGVLFQVDRDQSNWTSVTAPAPGTPVAMILDVPTGAETLGTPVRAEGKLVRLNGSAKRLVAVAVRGYWPE